MLTYNKQTNTYSRYIHKSEIEATLEKMKAISSRVQYKSIDDLPEGKQLEDFHLIIDDATSLEKLFAEIPSFKLEQPIDGLRRTLFLIACGMSEDTEGIEYLINKGAEVNRNDLLGKNALHMLVLNENMAEKDKVKAAQMLIDKDIDVNRPNIRMETPLMAALNHLEFDVANLLIDNGGYILRPPAQEEVQHNSTQKNTEKPTN